MPRVGSSSSIAGGRVDQRAGQRDALPLAGAERRAAPFEELREIEQVAQRPQILLRLPRSDAIQVGKEQQHLADREPGINAVARRDQPSRAFTSSGDSLVRKPATSA